MAKMKTHLFTLLIISIFFFPVHPVRSDEDFSRQGPSPTILTPHNRSDSNPQQVHISLVGKDRMRVTWITIDKHSLSTVEFGKISGRYEAKAWGEHTTYTYFGYSSGKIHHVTTGPLEPDTTYFYRCGGRDPQFSFKTPPSTFPLEFVVVGDLGQTEWTKSTLKHTNSKNYDVFLLPGDLSYANGHQQLWDTFGRLVEPYASTRPWMVTQGNHDIEYVQNAHPHSFKAYNARWLMPYEQSGSTSNLFYSFDVSGVHVIMLGSYAEFDSGSDQFKWLESDLNKIDRKETPWIFVMLHAPWYNTNTAHQGEGEDMRRALEELLYKARVDLVFSGHVHAYERFTRVYDNQADSCGPVYVTIGDGGNLEGLALTYIQPRPPLSLYREPSFGHGRLRILNQTHAHWSWHRNNDLEPSMADQLSVQSLSSSKLCWGNHDHHQPPLILTKDEF